MTILAQAIGIVEATASLEDEYSDSGFTIGREGRRCAIDHAYAHHSEGARRLGRLAFTAGNWEGLKAHAEATGYAQGLAGAHCDRPAEINRRLDREYIAGWQRGADEWADREAILREDEAQDYAIWFEREHADRDAEARFHEAEIAEARGYFSIGGDKGGHDR